MCRDATVTDDEPAVGELHDRVQEVNGVRLRSSETRGVGEVEEAFPVAQQSPPSARWSCRSGDRNALRAQLRGDYLRIRSVELHFQFRVGHDSWREPHVLVGLLTGIGRSFHVSLKSIGGRGAIPGFACRALERVESERLLPNPRERSR